MLRLRTAALAAAVTGLLGASCASAPPPTPTGPSVTAETTKIDERDQSLTGFKSVVEVALHNTGSGAASAQKAKYEVVIDEKVVDKGEVPVSGEVAPGTDGSVEIVVPYEYAKTPEELATLAGHKGPIDYVVRGVLDTSAGPVEFARRGAVRQPRLPVVVLDSIEAVNSKSQGLTVTAIVDVENPNPFPVQSSGLSWKLALSGQPTSDGVLGRKDSLKPASHVRYEISATLEPSEVEKRKDLLSGGNLPYALEGDLDVGLTKVPLAAEGTARLLRYGE